MDNYENGAYILLENEENIGYLVSATEIGGDFLQPTVETLGSNVTGTNAELNMNYDFNDFAYGSVRFKWRKDGESWSYSGWTKKFGRSSYSETITGLSPSTTYYYRAQIRFESSNKEGSLENFTTGVGDGGGLGPPYVPKAPENLSASAENSTQIRLEWDHENTDDFNYYNIYRSTSSDFSGADKIDNTTSKSYTDNNISADTTYYYKTTAVDIDGNESQPSNLAQPNSPPTADFDHSTSDLTVNVDGSPSYDNDGSISSYEWDWTSDETYEDTGETASHTYSLAGTYDITLRVTDDDGATDTHTESVSVSGCPYLYGWNGESYELINAIMPQSVLERYESISHQRSKTLKPRDNFYNLILFQKLPERAWINNLSLKAIDHPEDVEVLTDQAGGIYTIKEPRLVSAVNEEGENITPLIENSDGKYWTSDLKVRDFENPDDLVDHIYLDFSEKNNSRIKLIVRGRQTFFAEFSLWSVYHYLLGTPNSDYMISLLENDASGSLGSAFDKAFGRFSSIRIQYWNGSKWINFGRLGIMKAFFEKTVVPLDLGKIPGDRIRLSMTAGLYDIDQILVDNSERRSLLSRSLEPVQATKYGEKGPENVLKKVRGIDNRYTIIDQGEYINYKFERLEPPENGMDRTFILPTGGYFYLTGPEVPENKMYNLPLAENLARKPYRFESWILPRYTHPGNYPYTKYFNMSFADPPFEISE